MPSPGRTYLRFLFDADVTRKDSLFLAVRLPLQLGSSVFLPNDHLLYRRAVCLLDSLRSVRVDAFGKRAHS